MQEEASSMGETVKELQEKTLKLTTQLTAQAEETANDFKVEREEWERICSISEVCSLLAHGLQYPVRWSQTLCYCMGFCVDLKWLSGVQFGYQLCLGRGSMRSGHDPQF